MKTIKDQLKELIKNDSTLSEEDILYFSKGVKLKYKLLINEIVNELQNEIMEGSDEDE